MGVGIVPHFILPSIRRISLAAYIHNESVGVVFVGIVNILYYPQAFTWHPGATLGSVGRYPL
jgi:hypothetical protein